MIYIFLILFFSFLILNHLLNSTIEGFKEECTRLNNVECANIVSEENTGMINRMKKIAKQIESGFKKGSENLEKTQAKVAEDKQMAEKMKRATNGENVVNSEKAIGALNASKIPK